MGSIAPPWDSLDALVGGEPLAIEAVEARPLSVPLVEPFVIATGRVDVTRAVEVAVRVRWRGAEAKGLGEAACLPPVTREDQGDVLAAIEAAAGDLRAGALGPVARAGVETALLDAVAQVAGLPLRVLLARSIGREATAALETDVTIAIGAPAHMAGLAHLWFKRGFFALKVKVGKDLDADARALELIGSAARGARLRVDANAGYRARDAIDLARRCERLGLNVECWEQPCAEDDLDGLAEVSAALDAPVIADESVKSMDDLRVLIERRYADGVNLKLAKSGGPLAALAIGNAAKAAGLLTMIGGMVETRLGMTAAAHVACALGGVDFVDLDTALLLAEDPYEGGYQSTGPHYTMPETPGLGIQRLLAR